MDRYQKVVKPKSESPANENEIRITSQGLVRNYISYATTLLQERLVKEIVLKAMGQAIHKTVAIAEIIKRRVPEMHQDTVISSVSITDTFEPIEEGLQIVEQTRQVSMISITLSTKELNKNSPGYQGPSNVDQTKQQQQQQYNYPPPPPQQYNYPVYPPPQQHYNYPPPPQQYNYPPQQHHQQPPRQARAIYNAGHGDTYGRGGGRGRGRGRGWNRGGYSHYQENGGYSGGYWGGNSGGYWGGYSGGNSRGYWGGYSGGNSGGYSDGYSGGYSNGGRGGGRGGRGQCGGGYGRGRGGVGRGYGRGRGRMASIRPRDGDTDNQE